MLRKTIEEKNRIKKELLDWLIKELSIREATEILIELLNALNKYGYHLKFCICGHANSEQAIICENCGKKF